MWEPDYVTLAEVKAYLRIDDTDDDALLADWITTASRAVDTFCHRQFGQVDTAQARVYTPCWDPTLGWFADLDDLDDVTDLEVVDAAAIPVVDYTLSPVNAPQRGRVYTRILLGGPGAVTITAMWGWSAVPAAVKSATKLQVARLAARRDSPFGVAGSPAEGSEVRLLASLDPDLKTSLGARYRREWWAA